MSLWQKKKQNKTKKPPKTQACLVRQSVYILVSKMVDQILEGYSGVRTILEAFDPN